MCNELQHTAMMRELEVIPEKRNVVAIYTCGELCREMFHKIECANY